MITRRTTATDGYSLRSCLYDQVIRYWDFCVFMRSRRVVEETRRIHGISRTVRGKLAVCCENVSRELDSLKPFSQRFYHSSIVYYHYCAYATIMNNKIVAKFSIIIIITHTLQLPVRYYILVASTLNVYFRTKYLNACYSLTRAGITLQTRNNNNILYYTSNAVQSVSRNHCYFARVTNRVKNCTYNNNNTSSIFSTHCVTRTM